MIKKTSGFTLVEMIITIAAMSIVCAATALLMISTLRLHKSLTDTAQRQLTIQMISEAMDDLSGKDIVVENNTIKLNGSTQTYMENSGGNLTMNGTVILKNVTGFLLTPEGNHLLHYSITVGQPGGGKTYTGSVYFPLPFTIV